MAVRCCLVVQNDWAMKNRLHHNDRGVRPERVTNQLHYLPRQRLYH